MVQMTHRTWSKTKKWLKKWLKHWLKKGENTLESLENDAPDTMSGRAPEASSIEAADSEEEPDAENEALPAAHRTSGHGLTALRTKRRLVNATNRP